MASRKEVFTRNLLCAFLHGEPPPPPMSCGQIGKLLGIDKAQVVRGIQHHHASMANVLLTARSDDAAGRMLNNAGRRRTKPTQPED